MLIIHIALWVTLIAMAIAIKTVVVKKSIKWKLDNYEKCRGRVIAAYWDDTADIEYNVDGVAYEVRNYIGGKCYRNDYVDVFYPILEPEKGRAKQCLVSDTKKNYNRVADALMWYTVITIAIEVVTNIIKA